MFYTSSTECSWVLCTARSLISIPSQTRQKYHHLAEEYVTMTRGRTMGLESSRAAPSFLSEGSSSGWWGHFMPSAVSQDCRLAAAAVTQSFCQFFSKQCNSGCYLGQVHFGPSGALGCRYVLQGISNLFSESTFLVDTPVTLWEVAQGLVTATVPALLALQLQEHGKRDRWRNGHWGRKAQGRELAIWVPGELER